eukprot:COSAG02_NODE_591_length_19862_cov_8.047918_27_plen_179_part_00
MEKWACWKGLKVEFHLLTISTDCPPHLEGWSLTPGQPSPAGLPASCLQTDAGIRGGHTLRLFCVQVFIVATCCSCLLKMNRPCRIPIQEYGGRNLAMCIRQVFTLQVWNVECRSWRIMSCHCPRRSQRQPAQQQRHTIHSSTSVDYYPPPPYPHSPLAVLPAPPGGRSTPGSVERSPA